MLPAEQNYKTHYAELLAIVGTFKTWLHYLKRATYNIFVLTNLNNLKKLMETICLRDGQI